MEDIHVIIKPGGWLTILIFILGLFAIGYCVGWKAGYNRRDKEFNTGFEFEEESNNCNP